MKKILIFSACVVLLNSIALAQGKYKLSKAQVSFFSHAALEDIEATNSDAQGIVDFGSKNFLIKIPIKSFTFKSGLMQEHFNENYMESDKYPSAVFKGAIQGSYDLSKDGEYPVNAVGDLNVHGVSQPRTIPSVIVVKGGIATITSKINIKVADHKIDVPTIVFQKIAEVVEVKIDGSLVKM